MAPGSRVRRGRTWVRVVTSVVLTAAVVEYVVLPLLVRARSELAHVSGGTP
jgi:hypothetical protein